MSQRVPWNKGTTYATKAANDEYKNKKSWGEAVIRVRGNSCEVCGWNAARCDVHHRIPKAEGGRNTIENGRVLCPNCHRVEHAREWAQTAANDNKVTRVAV
jgi:5-methylcytosine-specific restriction endonuclease McrA